MDLPLSDFRRMEVEEFDTSKLLAHAAQQATERGYKNFPIVDVDSHHYESESIDEILEYMDDPVLQQLATEFPQQESGRSLSACSGAREVQVIRHVGGVLIDAVTVGALQRIGDAEMTPLASGQR